MKKFGIFLGIVILIGLSIFGYIETKKYLVKNDVHTYLLKEKNIKEADIEVLDPFVANLDGDKNWLVYVKIKNDPKKYYYYKNSDTDRILLESAE